jgi:hypothetical protein
MFTTPWPAWNRSTVIVVVPAAQRHGSIFHGARLILAILNNLPYISFFCANSHTQTPHSGFVYAIEIVVRTVNMHRYQMHYTHQFARPQSVLPGGSL